MSTSINNAEEKKITKKKDPLRYQTKKINEDFYSLVWMAIRPDTWKEKVILGEKINMTEANYRQIKTYFWAFVFIVLATISALLIEVFTLLYQQQRDRQRQRQR